MANGKEELPTVIDDEDTDKPQKVTDELPVIIGYPMKLIAFACRQKHRCSVFRRWASASPDSSGWRGRSL